MRSPLKCILSIAALAAGAAFTCHDTAVAADEPLAAPLMHRIYAGNLDSAGWVLAESTNGHFSVKVPGAFNDFSVAADPAAGTERTEGIGGRMPNGMVFSALEQVYKSKEAAKTEFESYKDGGGLPGASVKSATVAGAQALDISFSDDASAGSERVVLSGTDLFILNLKWPTAASFSGAEMGRSFFESLTFVPVRAKKPDGVAIWQPNQMNESFMRAQTKEACMNKTIATLSRSGCATRECLAIVGGATANCVSLASGSLPEFCGSYNARYVGKLCGPNGLDPARCEFLKLVKKGICETIPDP